ncbi:hypothetical protein OG693_39480 (plasmid) [Streptomyces sp. NBC_01259]|uniref:hypothetical protein n=1 Tax=Streptomyces sp. NBC_01259 TaxID=2903800 RepID=UPI002F90811E
MTATRVTELDNVLDDLTGLSWLPGIAQILDGIRKAQTAISQGDLTTDATQTLIAGIAGSAGADLITALAHLTAHAASGVNPSLRTLPLDQQKDAQRYGELVVYDLSDPKLHQAASEASAAISSY